MTVAAILVVDDNPVNLELASVVLAAHNYEIHTAESAEAATRVLETLRPALILMDLQLPGMNGTELMQSLKADPHFADVVIVAVTAFAMKGDEERALAAGFDGYVTKPIDTRALPKLIAEFLRER